MAVRGLKCYVFYDKLKVRICVWRTVDAGIAGHNGDCHGELWVVLGTAVCGLLCAADVFFGTRCGV